MEYKSNSNNYSFLFHTNSSFLAPYKQLFIYLHRVGIKKDLGYILLGNWIYSYQKSFQL